MIPSRRLLLPALSVLTGLLVGCGTHRTGNEIRGRFIRNGDVVTDGHYEEVKLLRIVDSPTTMRLEGFCTGTQIGPRAVLTAAHCISGESATAANRHFVGGKSGSFADTVRAASVHVHPSFSLGLGRRVDPATGKLSLGSSVDLAVIVLETEVPGPYAGLHGDALEAGERVVGVGFGQNRLPASAGVAGSGVKLSGNFRFDRYLPVQLPASAQLTDGYVVVTAADDRNQNECPGDSGGPILVEGDDGLEVAGVVNAGNASGADRCRLYTEGGYVAVRPHLDWIRSHLTN